MKAATAPASISAAAGARTFAAAPVCVGEAVLLPVDDGWLLAPVAPAIPEPVPVAVPVAPVPVPVTEAPEAEVVPEAARKRSEDWKVWQLDEEGMTGVYGGRVVRVAGMSQVSATEKRGEYGLNRCTTK